MVSKIKKIYKNNNNNNNNLFENPKVIITFSFEDIKNSYNLKQIKGVKKSSFYKYKQYMDEINRNLT